MAIIFCLSPLAQVYEKSRNILKIILCFMCSFLVDTTAFSSPKACTFYKGHSGTHFNACAEKSIHKNSCTIERLLVRYRGHLGSMYLPKYFVEVTVLAGRSQFESYKNLKSHLKMAENHLDKSMPAFLFKGLNNGGAQDRHGIYFWHARIIDIPYAATSLNYPSLPKNMTTVPLCFSGISEFVADQWNRNHVDSDFAKIMAPVAIPRCLTFVGDVANYGAEKVRENIGKFKDNLLGSIGIPNITSSFPVGCAYGVNKKYALYKILSNPKADLINPMKMCIGKGISSATLLPRMGLILTNDRFHSALLAAYKFSSLIGDIHPQHSGGVEPDDKWQLIYPKSSFGGCFRPGDSKNALMLETGRIKEVSFSLRNNKTDTYIFAVWKKQKTTRCLDPYMGEDIRWKKIMVPGSYLFHKAHCAVVGA